MSDRTNISWADATWNPIRGCSRVSEGCRNCYAERMASRFSYLGAAFHGFARIHHVYGKPGPGEPRWTGRVELVESKLTQPLRWNRPRRIFVNSMADLFHEALPAAAIARVFAIMQVAVQHQFLILTKRPENALGLLLHRHLPALMERFATADQRQAAPCTSGPWPLPNVWLGVSVEDQEAADARIPLLLETPAAVRFVSVEPMLGPVDLSADIVGGRVYAPLGEQRQVDCGGCVGSPVRGLPYCPGHDAGGVDWVICGSETGPGARPFRSEWAESLRDQCVAAGVPFFLKQIGRQAEKDRVLDGCTWDQFPMERE